MAMFVDERSREVVVTSPDNHTIGSKGSDGAAILGVVKAVHYISSVGKGLAANSYSVSSGYDLTIRLDAFEQESC